MTRTIAQSTIDATIKDVRLRRKPRELTACNLHGSGTLLLRLRWTAAGVTGTWLVRYVKDDERPTVTLGRYDAKDEAGGLSRDRAVDEFNAWVARRHDGLLLVKRSNRPGDPYMTEDEARPVLESETLEAMFKVFMDEYTAKFNTTRTADQRWSMWNCHCQAVAKLRARDVKPRQFNELVLAPMIGKGIRKTVEDVRKMLSNCYTAAMQVHAGTNDPRLPLALGDFAIESNPLAAIRSIRGAYNARNRPMPVEALAKVYAGLGDSLPDDLIRLSLLLAGTRFQQIGRLTRRDFDLDPSVRTVRLVDYKGRDLENPRVYTLPLGDEALRVARRVALALGDKPRASTGAYLGARLGEVMQAVGVRTADNPRQARDVRSSITTWFVAQGVQQSVSNFIQSHDLGELVDKHYINGGALEPQIKRALASLECVILGQATAELKAA